MTTLTSIIAPTNILTPSSSATVTNKTISGANNTLTVCLANDVSGALPVANGGFGQSSYTDGQLLIGNTAGSLTKTTLTAGTNIAITNSGGSISIAYDPPIVYNNIIYSWGRAQNGVLGDNTTTQKASPVSVVGGFTNWCQVASGQYHSLGVKQDGTAWAWGAGSGGRLGDNTTVDKSSPVSVLGGFTDWCQVAGGDRHSLGVKQDGTAWAWGSSSDGELGDNTTVSKSSPVSVVGGFCWCQIAAGNKTSFGIRSNGVLYAWGYNNSGRLGDNTTGNKSSPVSVVGGFTDWCFVQSCNTTLAVRTNGTAWAWGIGYQGQLGNGQFGSYGSPNNRSSPVSVVGGFTDWCQVSGGDRHSLGLRTNGVLYAWGTNITGQLGNNCSGSGYGTSKNSPVVVVGGFTDWCQVATGYNTGLGVRTNGSAWSWGSGSYGRLGNNGYTNKSSPVSVVGGFTDWCQVAGGRSHSVGLTSSTV